MDAWLVWKKAVPLSEAYLKFAPKDKARRYRELAKVHHWPAMLERAKELTREGVEPLAALKGSVLPSHDLNSLRDELRNACVQYVLTDALKAYGFATPRHPDHEPQPVPSDLWNAVINWEKSTLQANGLSMEGVRLIPPRWVDLTCSPESRSWA